MVNQNLDLLVEKVADLILDAKRIVVFTGAGVSTESGIPDFRSAGGIWDKFDPDDFTYQKFIRSPETRRKQWQMLKQGLLTTEVKPNPAHYAIVELSRLGKLDCVITQNIDNLHQKAGVPDEEVLELHGNMQWAICLSCGKRYPFKGLRKSNINYLPEVILERDKERRVKRSHSATEAMSEAVAAQKRPGPSGSPNSQCYSFVTPIKVRLDEGEEIPDCQSCHGILKPDAVFFGESLPEKVLREASERSRNCDLFIVIGSTLVVYPAAYMPIYATNSGAKLVIINLSPTPIDRQAAVLIKAKAGETMSKILHQVREKIT